MIAIVDPVPYDSNTLKYTLLIASFRKARNSQSLESRNQNLTYGIIIQSLPGVAEGWLVQFAGGALGASGGSPAPAVSDAETVESDEGTEEDCLCVDVHVYMYIS